MKIIAGYKWKEISDKDIEIGYIINISNVQLNDCEAVKLNNRYFVIENEEFGTYQYSLGKELSEAEVKGAIECMWDTFGGTKTDKGYKVLDQHIGLIYGDSITLERADDILQCLADKGFASSNVVFGVGSFTYTYSTRDTLGFAIKATAGRINGKIVEIYKDPKTDSGLKKSARGLLQIIKNGDNFELKDQASEKEEMNSELQLIFSNGKLVKSFNLAEIRDRIDNTL